MGWEHSTGNGEGILASLGLWHGLWNRSSGAKPGYQISLAADAHHKLANVLLIPPLLGSLTPPFDSLSVAPWRRHRDDFGAFPYQDTPKRSMIDHCIAGREIRSRLSRHHLIEFRLSHVDTLSSESQALCALSLYRMPCCSVASARTRRVVQ